MPVDREAAAAAIEQGGFPEFVLVNRARVEEALGDWLPLSAAVGTERLNEAVRFAVFPGGKRLRPLLTLLGARLGGATDAQALTLSCASEFIHTSSLIFDDLPSMDDAALRRGRPALHVVYGEGVAILTALALLNQSYAVFAAAAEGMAYPERLSRLIGEAAACVGSSGMIAGQAAEFASSGAHEAGRTPPSRDLKTTALMRLMLIAGAILAGGSAEKIAALAAYGEALGRAYQIHDDLADARGDARTTGKSVGQDERHQRPTVLRGLSHAEARGLAAELLEAGKGALAPFGQRPEARLLREAADHIFGRLGPDSQTV